MHALRVWVKRTAGWRMLVYQEVQSLDAPPTVTPSASKECQNPCKSVGYTPKTDAERAVIKGYEELETAAMAQDAANWDAHTGEEFIAASSNSDRLLDKPAHGRVAAVEYGRPGADAARLGEITSIWRCNRHALAARAGARQAARGHARLGEAGRQMAGDGQLPDIHTKRRPGGVETVAPSARAALGAARLAGAGVGRRAPPQLVLVPDEPPHGDIENRQQN